MTRKHDVDNINLQIDNIDFMHMCDLMAADIHNEKIIFIKVNQT